MLLILTQLFLGVFFLSFAFFSFTLPGNLIIKGLKLKDLSRIETFVLSSVVGIAVFTLAAYILAALNLRILMYLFLLAGIGSLILHLKFSFKINLKDRFIQVAGLVFFLGVIFQVAVNAGSGWINSGGIYFYSSHGHDGVWHLALMQKIQSVGFPFQNPEYASHQLQNYHFFVDLLMSEMGRLYGFNNLDIYFRFMPVVFSILMGGAAFILVNRWAKSRWAGLWAVFFTYFAGSFGYLLTIPRNHNLSGETIFWVSQTQSVLGNPPHAAAFVIFTTILFCLYLYLRNFSTKLFLLIVLLGGVIIEFKVYAGLILIGGLFVTAIFDAVFRRNFYTFLLFVATSLLAFIIYFPNSANSQEFLILQPWWFIRTMVVAPDRLNWLDLELRRQTYLSEHNYKRVVLLESEAFFIFLLGNLGMRVLGFLKLFSISKKIFSDPFEFFILSITVASFLIPVLFLQKGVAWNTIQFDQYFLLVFGFLAGISVHNLLAKFKSIPIKVLIASIIIIFAVPTQIGLLQQFYGNLPLSKVSFEQLAALNALKNNTKQNEVILTAPYNAYIRDRFTPPIPIYTWYDTGYVPAFSDRSTWLSDEEQVRIMGYQIDSQMDERRKAFEDPSGEALLQFSKKYQLKYIYLEPEQKFEFETSNIGLKLIYNQNNIRIYQI